MSETLEAIGAFPSLAAYFATHAPEKVPHWYTQLHKDEIPADYPAPRVPTLEDAENIIGRILTQDERCHLGSWINDPCWDLDGDLAKFETAMKEALDEVARDAWEYQQGVYFSWRVFYGEMMASMFEDAGEGES